MFIGDQPPSGDFPEPSNGSDEEKDQISAPIESPATTDSQNLTKAPEYASSEHNFLEYMKELNEAQREEVQVYVDVFHKWQDLGKDEELIMQHIMAYDAFCAFCKELNDRDSSEPEKTMIFHLFSLSTLSRDQWAELPLTSKSKAVENYIINKFFSN